jgi:adenine-specific DNA-methyltransferase
MYYTIIMDTTFMNQSMLTCIGNKRKLVSNIQNVIESDILPTLDKEKINFVDGFAGSSVVSRSLIHLIDTLHVNDLESYSYLMANMFFMKPSDENKETIKRHIEIMNKMATDGPFIEDGIIYTHYCPASTIDPKLDERCFYTAENGKIIDTLRHYIEENVEPEHKNYCLAALLIKASIHTNTAGVFKGFYKDKETGIGTFGGSAENALSRITRKIQLDVPIWSNHDYTAYIYNSDINELIKSLPNDIDVIYLDPPYNQHPYGSNYFMLNLITKNELPNKISKVSGIPNEWNRSNYNYKKTAVSTMTDLLKSCLEKSKYVLISYNNEGIIKDEDWTKIFETYSVTKKEIKYDTYKGSRNLKDRSNKVMEIIYIVSL